MATTLNTAHFSLEQRNGSLRMISGVRIADADGDVQSPDRLQMKYMMLLGGGMSAEERLIAIGNEQFVTNPLTGGWRASLSANAAPRFLDRDRGVSNLLRTISDSQRLSNELLDSVPTLHIMGNVRTSAFADMTDSQPTTDVVPGEVWVGVEDFLVRQLLLEGPIDAGDTDSTIRILKFSNFNQPMAIERPAT